MSEKLHPVPPVSGYRQLSQTEVDLMNEGKAVFNAVGAYLDKLDKYDYRDEVQVGVADPLRLDNRCLNIARTNAQTAAMWAIRAITKPGGFA